MDDNLLGAAGRVADGELIDWASVTSTLGNDHDRAIADELAVVQQIALGHRQLHQLLPALADTPPHLMPDRARWGHLDLLNVVGRGSYGMVYRAWDTRLERLVALKLFHGASDPDQVMQEGRMLARVRHENVVTVYGADVIDGVAGIWMELVHGKTLDSIAKADGPLPAREAASIGADVARALGAVHAAALLHCDVKAQNVVRENSGRVVLMDLGAGRLVPEARDTDQLSDVAGTPRYMAPELFDAGSSATKASDIYSLGVLVYYLVSGQFPVEGKTLGELKRSHETGKVRSLASLRPDLPKPLIEIITRAIDRDPMLRPWSAVDMQSALSAIALEPDVEAVRPAPVAWWWIGAAVAAITLALVLLQPLLRPAVTAPAIQSIAVLPIRNLTGDPSKAYVADGLTEVLISNLARIRSLRVPSFAAVNQLRGADAATPETAKRLGVQLLLAGSIATAGDQVRLNVRLVDAQGTVTWGDEITREMAGIVAAQSDLTRRLIQHLALKLSDADSRLNSMSALSARAQDAYLRGLALRVSSPNAQADAARAFREAADLEPALADAWAQLSLIETVFAERSEGDDRERSRRLARQLAERAIALDPGEPNGYAALGSIQFYTDWDFTAAAETLRKAVELSPAAAFARQRYSMLLAAVGRLPEAIAVAQQGEQLEPGVALRATTVGTAFYYARDFSHASEAMRRALSVTPDFGVAHFGLGRIASAQGQHDVAIAEIERALAQSRSSSWLVELARAYAAAGRPDDVKTVIAELDTRQRTGDRVSPDNLAYIAAAEGRADDALRILEDAADRHVAAMLWIGVDPRVDPLRGNPRFEKLLVRMGLRP